MFFITKSQMVLFQRSLFKAKRVPLNAVQTQMYFLAFGHALINTKYQVKDFHII